MGDVLGDGFMPSHAESTLTDMKICHSGNRCAEAGSVAGGLAISSDRMLGPIVFELPSNKEGPGKYPGVFLN